MMAIQINRLPRQFNSTGCLIKFYFRIVAGQYNGHEIVFLRCTKRYQEIRRHWWYPASVVAWKRAAEAGQCRALKLYKNNNRIRHDLHSEDDGRNLSVGDRRKGDQVILERRGAEAHCIYGYTVFALVLRRRNDVELFQVTIDRRWRICLMFCSGCSSPLPRILENNATKRI